MVGAVQILLRHSHGTQVVGAIGLAVSAAANFPGSIGISPGTDRILAELDKSGAGSGAKIHRTPAHFRRNSKKAAP